MTVVEQAYFARDVVSHLKATGGGTWDVKTRQEMGGKPLFAVSMYKNVEERVHPAHDLERAVSKFLTKNKERLSMDMRYLGIWRNEQNGMVYLDVTIVTEDKELAVAVAARHDQIAIFDLANYQDINVN